MGNPLQNIEFHADDYGMFLTQSQRILECHTHGRLNGISIMPNGEDLTASMALLGPEQKNMAMTVHLSLWSGKGLSREPLLTDEKGNLRCSFGKLLLMSYLPGREELRRQLKMELRAQIQAVAACLEPEKPLRLDGHAHYHMVPVVFDALMDVIREDKLDVSYIRMPREKISLYWRHRKQLHVFPPINLVKVAILNLLVWRNTRKYREELSHMERKLFLGVFLSGRMYRENVEPLLPDALALAEKRGWGLEILAHPGGVYEPEDIARITAQDDVHFLTSPYREKEASLFKA